MLFEKLLFIIFDVYIKQQNFRLKELNAQNNALEKITWDNKYLKLKYSNISNEDLDEDITKLKKIHSLAGEKMMVGFLRAKGIIIQRSRVRDSIHRVDHINTINRWLQKNPRWVYSVPGPNSLWHNDGLHKLIHWGIVIHACIDGFSRLVTSLFCATNNYAESALKGFLQGLSSFGIPARVRGDKGGENVDILRFMRQKQGNRGGFKVRQTRQAT